MHYFKPIFLLIAIFSVTACGGGGGGNGGSSGTAPTETYLFYAAGLNAVDPANPGSPTEIVPAANLVTGFDNFSSVPLAVLSGTYDGVAQTLSDVHTHSIIYAHTDGKLYKVSALKSASLTPAQVSNETMADQICMDSGPDNKIITDFPNIDNSQFIYVLPGTDSLCDTTDDESKMVRLSMSATDTPITSKPPVIEIFDSTTGAISGWLVYDSMASELQRCDINFANCSMVVDASSVDAQLQVKNFILLEIANTLFIYNSTTGNLSSAVFSIPMSTFPYNFWSDDSTVYFVLGPSIYQLPVDGSAMATPLVTESVDIQEVASDAETVVYTLGSTGPSKEIKSIPKTGGTPTSLVTVTGTDSVRLMLAKNNRVYYNVQNTTISGTTVTVVPVAAGTIDDNGMNQTETADANWAGITFNTRISLAGDTTISDIAEKVLLIEGYDIAGTDGGYAGATLKAVDATTATTVATLGTLPTTDYINDIDDLECFGFGDDMLCSVAIAITPTPMPPASPFQSDIFYLNASTANSLTRITNTAGENESRVN